MKKPKHCRKMKCVTAKTNCGYWVRTHNALQLPRPYSRMTPVRLLEVTRSLSASHRTGVRLLPWPTDTAAQTKILKLPRKGTLSRDHQSAAERQGRILYSRARDMSGVHQTNESLAASIPPWPCLGQPHRVRGDKEERGRDRESGRERGPRGGVETEQGIGGHLGFRGGRYIKFIHLSQKGARRLGFPERWQRGRCLDLYPQSPPPAHPPTSCLPAPPLAYRLLWLCLERYPPCNMAND